MSKIDYAKMQSELTKILNLKFPPVAVALIRKEGDIPKDVAELDKPMFYCGMIKYAMLGNTFYAKENKHSCRRGAAALGMIEIPEDERTGEFYLNKESCSSLRAAVRFVLESPSLEPRSVYATLLSPLEKTPVDPDVVIMEMIPRRAFEVMHASIFDIGGKVESWMSAPRQLCGASTVRPYLGKLNITFACEFARMAAKAFGAKYMDEGVILGIPGELLQTVVENLGRIGYVRKRLGTITV
ncbi:MAG: DUF169 domain-containing protein [Nitrososphaerales archaeon]